MTTPLFTYDGQRFPEYLKHGNAMQFIAPTAAHFCRGHGLDVGASRWPLPGAEPVDLSQGGDAMALHDGQWDYIFSSHCLEHIPDAVGALMHWKTRIKPGGVLFLFLPHPDMTYDEKKAVATIESRSDSHVTGEATFSEANGKVTLKITIEGAEPGAHAVHLNEKGDCTAPDGVSAGGHWNPTHENHGKCAAAPFHRGDIGNIEIGADGKGTFILTTDLWTIGGSPETNVIGKGIIIHAKADEFTTQPTGNAGGRVGCGVAQAARK